MSDSGLTAALNVKFPDMTGEMIKLNQLNKYSLDVAKEAQEYNALKQYGEGAMRDDPEAKVMLGSKHPSALSTIESLKGTAVQTNTAKQKLATDFMSQSALELSQVEDPRQRISGFHQKLDMGLKSGYISQAEADYAKAQAASNPNWVDSLIMRAVPPQMSPGVQEQQGWASAGPQSALNTQQGSFRERIPLFYKNDKGEMVPYTQNPTMQPGAVAPFGGRSSSGSYRYGPPSSVPRAPEPGGASSGTGPRSDVGGPRASLASYTQMADDDGSTGEVGFAGPTGPSPSLPQAAFKNRLFGQESGNKDIRNAAGSSASGLGQFIDSTWKSQMQKLIPDQVAGMSDAQIGALRSDSQLQHAATISYAEDNAKVLAQAGLPATAANLAMAHKLGPEGAVKVLNANPNTSMVSILGGPDTKATQQNPTWARQSVAGFVNSHRNAFGDLPIRGIATPATSGAAPTAAPAADRVTPSNAIVPHAERSGPAATRGIVPAGAPAGAPSAPGGATLTVPPPDASRVVSAQWTPGPAKTGFFTYGGGDSIGLGFIKAGGVPGTVAPSTTVKGSEHKDGVGSRNPQQALDFITANPERFDGQDVLWSTGLYNSGGVENAEANLPLVEKQIAEMKKANVNNIVLAGVQEEGAYSHLNDSLAQIAEKNNIQFGGPLPTSKIHPDEKGYKDYVQNAARTLEQKRTEAEPTGRPQDTVENPPGTPGMLPRSALQNVADTSGGGLPSGGAPLPTPGGPDILLPTPGARGGLPSGGAPLPSAGPSADPPGSVDRSQGLPPGAAPMPTQAEQERAKQEALQPGKLYEQRIEAEQSAEAQSAQKVYDESRAQSHEAQVSMQQLHQITNMLDQTTTGMTAPIRQKFMSAFSEFAMLAGRDDNDAGKAAAKLALISTAGSELAFAMVKALGSREAQQVVQQVMNIKPNIMLSNEENKMIVASLKQGMQMSIDRHDFIVKNRAKMGIHGAEHEFMKENPPEVYASKVVPFPYPDSPEEAKKGVIYNTEGIHKFSRGKWDGKNMDPVK